MSWSVTRCRRNQLLKRLRRIEGQVRGPRRLVAIDADYVDVLPQISATTRALHSVGIGLLHDHRDHCARDTITAGGPGGRAKVEEALVEIERLVKSEVMGASLQIPGHFRPRAGSWPWPIRCLGVG